MGRSCVRFIDSWRAGNWTAGRQGWNNEDLVGESRRKPSTRRDGHEDFLAVRLCSLHVLGGREKGQRELLGSHLKGTALWHPGAGLDGR